MDTLKKLAALLTLSLVSLSAVAKTSIGPVKKVESQYVCMVTNAVFPTEQIEVKVDEKKYYGCCENCKATLNNDESSRYAVDPVTLKKVDKALAVIGATQKGKILYFESDKSLNSYNSLQK